MLDQEDDPELNYEWLTADEGLTYFSKAREQILGRVKVEELPSVKLPQSSEEDPVVRGGVPIRTKRLFYHSIILFLMTCYLLW